MVCPINNDSVTVHLNLGHVSVTLLGTLFPVWFCLHAIVYPLLTCRSPRNEYNIESNNNSLNFRHCLYYELVSEGEMTMAT